MKKVLTLLFIAALAPVAFGASAAFTYDPAASGATAKQAKDNLIFPAGSIFSVNGVFNFAPTSGAADFSSMTSVLGLTKTTVGLANIDNTSDANKPISTATQTALGLKLAITTAASTYTPLTRTINGYALSANITLAKADLGLGNVDNTSDASKPISTAAQAALDAKQGADADLTAIAALATTSFGRGVLTETSAATLLADTLQAAAQGDAPFAAPVPLGVREMEPSIIREGSTLHKWARDPADGGGDDRVRYFTANVSNPRSWTVGNGGTPVIPAGYVCPYVIKVASTYYMFCKKESDSALYMFTSTDKVTWSLGNAGAPVLNKSSTPGDYHYTLHNAAVAVDGAGNWHLWIEARASTGPFVILYSRSTLAAGPSFDAGLTASPVLPGPGGASCPFVYYNSTRDAMLILYSYTDVDSAGPMIFGATAAVAELLATGGGNPALVSMAEHHVSSAFRITHAPMNTGGTGPGTNGPADPHVVDLGSTGLLLAYNYDQVWGQQATSTLTFDQLYLYCASNDRHAADVRSLGGTANQITVLRSSSILGHFVFSLPALVALPGRLQLSADQNIGWGGTAAAGANPGFYSNASFLVANSKGANPLYLNYDNANPSATVNLFAGNAIFTQSGTLTLANDLFSGGTQITASGVVRDAAIASTIARDSEVTAAVSALSATLGTGAYQPQTVLTGTANQLAVSNGGVGATTLSLPDPLILPGLLQLAADKNIGWGGTAAAGANPGFYSNASFLVANSKGANPLYLNFDNSNPSATVNLFAGNAIFTQSGTLTLANDLHAVAAVLTGTITAGSSAIQLTDAAGMARPAALGTGSSIATKFLRGDGTWQSAASGDALTSGTLAQFAATSSAELKTLLSDELGTGKAIFSDGTLAITAAKTFSVANTLTLSGNDGGALAIGGGGTLGTGAYQPQTVLTGTANQLAVSNGGVGATTLSLPDPLILPGLLQLAADKNIGWGGTAAAGANPGFYSNASFLVANSKGANPLYLNYDNTNPSATVNLFAGNAVFTQSGTLTLANDLFAVNAALSGVINLGHASDTTISRVSAGVIAVEGVNVLLNGGALGTPSSATLTNASGLPISGIASLGTGVGTALANAINATGGFVAVDGSATLTSKTLTSPTINGGTHTGITGLGIRDTSAAFDVTFAAVSSSALSAGRTITFDVINAARTIKLAGNLDFGGAFTTGSAFSTSGHTLTTNGVTYTLSGATATLATLAGSESLTNKKLGSLTTNGIVRVGSSDGTLSSAELSGAVTTSGSNVTSIGSIPGRLLSRTIVLNGTTTYTTPASCTKILVQMVAAGGGGGGCTGVNSQAAAGGGGGGGSYAEKIFTVTASTGYTVAVGAAGTGGSGTGPANGNTGGVTTIVVGATTVTCNGGLGGVAMAAGTTVGTAALGGAGGAVSTNGDLNLAGQPGAFGLRMSGSLAVSGHGADGLFGQGGGNALITAAAGNNAGNYGAGGGGALSLANTNRAGGDGSNGVIIVWEFSS